MTPLNTKSTTKGFIYYSDDSIEEPIKSWVFKCLGDYKTIPPGVFSIEDENPGYKTMVKQIIDALERINKKYVFFCEHDVLYPPSHFDFNPPRDDIFYYNENVWRWDYPTDRIFTYDRLISLSGMCCNRSLALKHFNERLEFMEKSEEDFMSASSLTVRKMGFEPGTKKKKRGGFSDDDFETWTSEEPIIDIRHGKTFSPRKTQLTDFKHQPRGWREDIIQNTWAKTLVS